MAEIDQRDMFEQGGREERVMWMDAFGVQPSMLFPVETDEEVSKTAWSKIRWLRARSGIAQHSTHACKSTWHTHTHKHTYLFL